MKKRLPIALILVLLLMISSATAGIIMVPINGSVPIGSSRYSDLERVPSEPNLIRIRTTVSSGEFTIDCEADPECEAAGLDGLHTYEERMELVVDLTTGKVKGRTAGSFLSGWNADFRATIKGDATCLDGGDLPCDQMAFDLDLRGKLFNSNNEVIGFLRLEMTGIFVHNEASGEWGWTDLYREGKLKLFL